MVITIPDIQHIPHITSHTDLFTQLFTSLLFPRNETVHANDFHYGLISILRIVQILEQHISRKPLPLTDIKKSPQSYENGFI